MIQRGREVKHLSFRSKPSASTAARVVIVGPLKLQNELLAWFLNQNTGLTCICCKDLDLDSFANQSRIQPGLILLDCLGYDLGEFWSRFKDSLNSSAGRFYVALLNVAAGRQIDNNVFNGGIRGIFYTDDPLANFAKGVSAMLNGELWFSRELLMKCLFNVRPAETPANEDDVVLTSREQEILAMIASGVPNNQIAGDLGISPHTVKTHIRNIYGKINVPNRFQAALWAAKNL
jgi:LuxR family transcriptional regulator, positive regulator of biofilm formation